MNDIRNKHWKVLCIVIETMVLFTNYDSFAILFHRQDIV